MSDISNRVVVGLLVIALMVSFASIVVTVNKYKNDGEFITGHASDDASGISTLTISSATEITNNIQTIPFGSGYVNATCDRCDMDSAYGIQPGNDSCCVGFSNVTEGFLLENTGNINISVNYTCAGSCTAATFIGSGTTPLFQLNTSTNLQRQLNNETGTLDTVDSCLGDGGLNITSYISVTEAGDWLCGNDTTYPLDYADAQDAFSVDLYVSIPDDAPSGTGTKTATFTFGATSGG